MLPSHDGPQCLFMCTCAFKNIEISGEMSNNVLKHASYWKVLVDRFLIIGHISGCLLVLGTGTVSHYAKIRVFSNISLHLNLSFSTLFGISYFKFAIIFFKKLGTIWGNFPTWLPYIIKVSWGMVHHAQAEWIPSKIGWVKNIKKLGF